MGWELDFLGPSYIKKNYFFLSLSSVILSISPNCCNCMECFSRFSLFYYLYSLTASTCCRTESEKKEKDEGNVYIYLYSTLKRNLPGTDRYGKANASVGEGKEKEKKKSK